MKFGIPAAMAMAAVAVLSGCSERKAGAAGSGPIRFITLDPGHFHAALVQNRTYAGVADDVRVYAPAGQDLENHLKLIEAFNTRAKDPTRWREQVYRGDDFLERMLADRAGDVVVLAGKNNRKPDYYLAAAKAGFNVLSDKPMVIRPEAFAKLEAAVAAARAHGKCFADIMTERSEITTILQRALVGCKELYGEQEPGTADDPAVTKISVHHFCKLVNGKPLQRPGWYYDTDQQGEAIVDVTTHLVDLVQWEAFQGCTLDRRDVKMLKARSWATPITAADYEKSTGLKTWPDFLKRSVDPQNVLQCLANGEFTYALRGVHAKVSVEWHFMAPPGTGDTHYSLMRGTKAEVVIRQGPAENYKPRVYVKPRPGQDPKALEKALAAAVAKFCETYPGVTFSPCDGGWAMNVPQRYDIGHEAHFSQVMNRFLGWVREGREPDEYLENMLVKYYTLAEAWKLAHR